MRKGIVLGLTAAMVLSLTACGGGKTETTKAQEETSGGKSSFSVAMITDTGGINDQSFNQSAWEGLTELKNKTGAEVNYIESKQASDFVTNLERLGDSGANLLWGVGYACADAVLEAAGSNPDIQYAIIDNAYENTPSNVTGVMFRAQEPSFLVGYVAGRTTQTGKVGFVGGISSGLIDQFQYGFEAGVKYAAKELGKDIDISVQYAESFSDAAKGKAIAARMYSDGCDVIYHAAGGTGTGVIEAAKEADKWVIGVDRDQAYLAPENVLTSALKLVGKAVQEVSEEAMNGKEIGGQTLTFGLQEDCVGIPEEHGNMAEGVYEDTLKVKDKIKNGELTPPTTKEEYEAFIAK
ncbi:MAG: BMP family ABC transporter substrate-binding protein [Lachnospiraceae bacterium]|uniref:Membrane protein n=2 Tax=Bacillota TaxID=1239 RepID=A0A084JLW4_9FIRM|nr:MULTISPECIES: BMP family ABC transporter substrate-binding protein [Clostridia]KEZ89948.1 membrane protein [Lacrimispora celerecrescens]MBW4845156.1 BMP family ABC transporter substrate-binding protein [Lachnospiraceae bacterium]MSS09966.1 BMP family ABC transporter substrate-binding protein [Clostridium sp. WB02_MRS01]